VSVGNCSIVREPPGLREILKFKGTETPVSLLLSAAISSF